MAKAEKETPLMQQYNAIKAKYPDALLLFRVGDFYETFSQDAIRAASVLGITLTRRANGAASEIELAGFPHHSLETYLPRLVRAGMRVAVCDQLEDPKLAKGIVKRGVTELVTPGVSLNDNVLSQRSNNFLCAIHWGDRGFGAGFLDISTGEFLVSEGDERHLQKLLHSLSPSEVLLKRADRRRFAEQFGDGFCTFTMEDWAFTSQFATDIITERYGVRNLKGFGIDHMLLGTVAAGAVLQYLRDTEHTRVAHVRPPARLEEDRLMWIDGFTARNLELIRPAHPDGKALLDVLDRTLTPMGARLMRRWVLFPLKDRTAIHARLAAVTRLLHDDELSHSLSERLRRISDLERLASKVSTLRINPRECIVLRDSLVSTTEATDLMAAHAELDPLAQRLRDVKGAIRSITSLLNDDVPVAIQKGGTIRPGVSPELDELRHLMAGGKEKLLEIQARERVNTGISSLKVSYNNVFGYYLEVTSAHAEKVPSDWVRKQTLTNAERYITPELKEYESRILGAEERILLLETELYNGLIQELMEHLTDIQINAGALAEADCLLSFASVSRDNQYTQPHFTDDQIIDIKDGRHPVIERCLDIGEEYVPNDLYLRNDQQQILIITGPNMSGKSALLRQTALIVIMAQLGCYVPARSATLGLHDKVFSRVGASDNLATGESTFMVEMNESASILNNMTSQSLLIFDEIGRGTSTYDGISIAMSMVEHLHNGPKARPNVLFATHYHELNELETRMQRVRNFHVSVKEVGNKVIFLRKLVPGGTEHSFGIHVAKMAGMPALVINRANEILRTLEEQKSGDGPRPASHRQSADGMQLSFFQLDDPILEQVREEILKTDIDTLTPVEALMKLHGIKKVLTGKR